MERSPDAPPRETSGWARLAVVAAIGGAVFLGLGAWAVYSLRESNDAILAALTQPTMQATRTISVDWTCVDGEAIHVEATSFVNEPRDLFFSRFDLDVAERERNHPRR